MKTSVASVRNLIVVVLVIALDFHLVRNGLVNVPSILHNGWPLWIHVGFFGYESWPVWFRAGFVGSLPMANAVLVGGAVLLPWHKGSRPFLTGFVLTGAFAMFALLALCLVLPSEWFATIYLGAYDFWFKLYLSYRDTLGLYQKEYFLAAELVLYTVLFAIPELLIAVTGGLMARRSSRVGPDSVRIRGASIPPSGPP